MAILKMRLGKFTLDQYGMLRGTISGLGIGSTDVVGEDTVGREGKHYLKLIADPYGVAYEVGAAFPKLKGDMAYYSVNLESPAFPAPVSAALFPDRDVKDEFNLVWERPEPLKLSVEATATANPQQYRRSSLKNNTPNTTS